MPGELDQAYIRARTVLLDAIEALRDHLDALVLVGAQAIYLHTGEADLALLPYTTDADIAIDPRSLGDDPQLGAGMARAGFVPDSTDVGVWLTREDGVQIDLLVPASVGGAGRRGARLGVHGNRAAKKVAGLEAALVDRGPMTVGALEASDHRRVELAVAGPAALLVAKLHKVGERRDQPRRQDDKDAYDVYRLLYGFETADLVPRFQELLRGELARSATLQALAYLRELFSVASGLGATMAARNVHGLGDPALVAASVAALATDLLDAL